MENVSIVESTESNAVTAPYKTDALRHGIGNSAVSSQWWQRPDDQKFLSVDELLRFKEADYSQMNQRIVDTRKFEIRALERQEGQNPMYDRGDLVVEYTDKNGDRVMNKPTNWSFGQMATRAGAPAKYLRTLPAELVADNLTWSLKSSPSEAVQIYGEGDRGNMRALTSKDYGRIPDVDIVRAVSKLDLTRWKIPGMMTGSRDGMAIYDPDVPVTKDTTTLYASDRDVFMFLVDDRNPIEVGKLANGEPDLMFRGFYVWNSETGSKTAGVAAMYLRGVCMNRNLWGVENFQEIKLIHRKHALTRFYDEMAPALQGFAQGEKTQSLIDGVEAAKARKIAKDDEERLDFLKNRVGLPKLFAQAAMSRHMEEEQKPIESVWDAAQAITAQARDIPHQDDRVDVELKAKKILDQVIA